MAFQQLSIDRDDPFDFLKLPGEIRNEIYFICFLADYEIVMHPEEAGLSDVPASGVNDQPCVALLHEKTAGLFRDFSWPSA